MNPKLRYVLIMLVGTFAAMGGAWLCASLWGGWGGAASAVFLALLIGAICIPLLDDCVRDMHQ